MTIWMQEQYKSRDGTLGQQTTIDVVYFTGGEPDETVAFDYVYANVPNAYNGLPLRTIQREQQTEDLYKWTVNYGMDASQVNPTAPVLQFTIGGGTVHITNSLGTPTKYVDSSLIPSPIDYGGAIGVELSGDANQIRVRGVDIQAPVLDYSLEMQFANELVTDDYISGIYGLALTPVNNDTFFGRPAGSVLFKGCRGTKKGQDLWDLIFDFSYSPNATGLVVGNITGISKGGWQYLDTLYVPPSISRTSTGIKIVQPGMVSVHTVYPSGDFTVLGIGA